MATMTLSPSAVGTLDAHTKADVKRPSYTQRFYNAVVESRTRRAEIEIRRVRALIHDKSIASDYEMLPFSGQ